MAAVKDVLRQLLCAARPSVMLSCRPAQATEVKVRGRHYSLTLEQDSRGSGQDRQTKGTGSTGIVINCFLGGEKEICNV